jgi:3-deoxy-D-manno-octulosonic-acid transferase
MSRPFALAAYRAAGHALEPFASLWLALRSRNGKEDPARVPERFGHAALPRPEGPLVWLHGASVGETRVLMSLRDGLAARRADLNFLITTGTRTSAALVAADRHPRTRHQFAPLDRDRPVQRFLDHWRPDLGVFAESEVWPNLILEAARRDVPLALINASMGARSLATWARAPQTAATVFAAFKLILAADSTTARGLEKLAGRPVPAAGNLKLAAASPAPDAEELAAWRAALAGRAVWLAASTHEGEEEIVLNAHATLRALRPDALAIIAPRHPERGDAVAALAGAPPRRSRGDRPSRDDSVFLVDTLGELGLFFALAPVVLVGGSLLPPLEGHNPVEPSRAGAAVISGPYVSSFAEIYEALGRAQAMIEVRDADEAAAAVAGLWSDEAARTRQVAAARAAIESASPGLDRTISDLLALMPPVHAPA